MNFRNKLLNFVVNSDLAKEEKKNFIGFVNIFSEKNCQQLYFAIIKSPKKIKQIYQSIKDRMDVASNIFRAIRFDNKQSNILLNEIFSLSDEQIKEVQKTKIKDVNVEKAKKINKDFENEQKDLRDKLEKFLEVAKSQVDSCIKKAI